MKPFVIPEELAIEIITSSQTNGLIINSPLHTALNKFTGAFNDYISTEGKPSAMYAGHYYFTECFQDKEDSARFIQYFKKKEFINSKGKWVGNKSVLIEYLKTLENILRIKLSEEIMRGIARDCFNIKSISARTITEAKPMKPDATERFIGKLRNLKSRKAQ